MKEITLKVPTAKLRFFMQLFKQLGLEVKDEEELVISKEHQKIVSDRIESTKEDDLLDWEEIKDDLFKVNPQAKLDIQDQIYYYNKQQKGLGKRFHNDVKSTFKNIRKNPFFQTHYKDIRCLPLKKIPSMVHYTVDENQKQITVRAVFYTSQDPQKWKKR
jgi:plasmid stabilization system protein ParE